MSSASRSTLQSASIALATLALAVGTLGCDNETAGCSRCVPGFVGSFTTVQTQLPYVDVRVHLDFSSVPTDADGADGASVSDADGASSIDATGATDGAASDPPSEAGVLDPTAVAFDSFRIAWFGAGGASTKWSGGTMTVAVAMSPNDGTADPTNVRFDLTLGFGLDAKLPPDGAIIAVDISEFALHCESPPFRWSNVTLAGACSDAESTCAQYTATLACE
jgi:hypothetical protein